MNNVIRRRLKRKARSPENKGGPGERLGTAVVVTLVLTAFIATLAYGAVDPWANGMLAILAAVIILLWIAHAWRSGALNINVTLLLLPLAAWVVIGMVQLLPLRTDPEAAAILGIPVSSALSLDPYATRMFTVRLVIMLVFFAAALTFFDSLKKIELATLSIVIFGAALAFFGVLQKLSGTTEIYGMRKVEQTFPFGTFVNQHHFAALMEMISGLAIAMLIGPGVTRERRIFVGLAAALMGIVIVFTGSRGGMLSYIGVIAVVTVLTSVRRSDTPKTQSASVARLAAFGGGAALLIGVIAVAFFLGGGSDLFRGFGPQAGDITSGRTHFWSVGWQIFTHYPIIGAGFDAFGAAFTRFDTWNGMYRIEQAHNDYLQTLADAGIAGFICVIGFIYLIARTSLTVIARSTGDVRTNIAIGALAGCTGIFIHSLFDFPLRTTSNAFFFLLLVAFACVDVADKTKNSGGRRRASNQSAG